jgi:hypothetical protein
VEEILTACRGKAVLVEYMDKVGIGPQEDEMLGGHDLLELIIIHLGSVTVGSKGTYLLRGDLCKDQGIHTIELCHPLQAVLHIPVIETKDHNEIYGTEDKIKHIAALSADH